MTEERRNDNCPSLIDNAWSWPSRKPKSSETVVKLGPQQLSPDPNVGCVVLMRDGRFVSGHRGELNPGEHAEFTVLERKMSNEVLAGATVFTTLEPCTDRNPPKISCADRLIERRVKKVFIGYMDPDRRGTGFQKLARHGIEVDLFPKDLMDQIQDLNREFIASRTRPLGVSNISTKNPAKNVLVRPIIVVGSGNTEHVLTCPDKLQIGEKHIVRSHDRIGGGGVNYATRLLAVGIPVLPIIAVGGDKAGELVQKNLLNRMRPLSGHYNNQASSFVAHTDFLINGYNTPQSTIIIADGKRTIFGELHGEVSLILPHANRQLEKICDIVTEDCPGAMMVGHLPTANNTGPGSDITITAINTISERYPTCPIFVNFGQKQLAKGYSYWKAALAKAFYVQFNIFEARDFFKEDVKTGQLADLIDFLSGENINSVITLDKFGAVAVFGRNNNAVMFAWPLIEDESQIVDPTGGRRFRCWCSVPFSETTGPQPAQLLRRSARGTPLGSVCLH